MKHLLWAALVVAAAGIGVAYADAWQPDPGGVAAENPERPRQGQSHAGVCGTCHRTHDASVPVRLTNLTEEALCLQCHDGSSGPGGGFGTPPNIELELQKTYRHPVDLTPSVHSPEESPIAVPETLPEVESGRPRHAECFDCHDHHAVERGGGARFHTATINEVWGVNESAGYRDPALAEFEVCLKCHGDSANRPQPQMLAGDYPIRLSTQATPFAFNTRLEIQVTNASFHPIVAALNLPTGVAGDVPSLRTHMVSPGGQPLADKPLSPATVIACTDCHNNDSGRQLGPGFIDAAGPHGSDLPFLLERRYMLEPPVAFPGETGIGVFYALDSYSLCDKCHDVAGSVMFDESFPYHDLHVREDNTSCSTCHAPHGVFGGTPLNNTHLIDFDTRIVAPDDLGRLRFDDQGFRSGACYLTCHGERHDPESY